MTDKGHTTFGTPGTRIIKSETEASEIKAYVSQALIIALAGDAFISCLLIIAAFAGYLTVIPLTVSAALGLLLFTQWLFDVRYPFVWHGIMLTRGKLVRLTLVVSVLVGVLVAKPMWAWITGYGAIAELINLAVAAFTVPWYVYVVVGLLMLLLAFRGLFGIAKRGVAALVVVWLAYRLQNVAVWDIVFPRLRAVCVLLVTPWIVSAMLITFVVVKNTLFPYLDYNLKPFDLSELRDVGLVGLLFPNLVGGKPKPPKPERFIKVDVSERGGLSHRYIDLPDSPAWIDFFRAVMRGASFSTRDAVACGVPRAEFERVRDLFVERGLAIWNSSVKTRGVSLNAAGRHVVAELAALNYHD